MYSNREDAGRKLAAKLLSGHHTADIVVGLARGGVAISHEISQTLDIPHGVLVVKKIGSPGNPELAIGAVVPDGQPLTVWDKTIILTDDGAATGFTMCAAVAWAKKNKAKKIIVALPVASTEAMEKLRTLIIDVIVLETPSDFGAVGEFYKNFPQLSDEDVIKLRI